MATSPRHSTRPMNAAQIIDAHRLAGRRFTAAGTESFLREEGSGEAVVCIHGVPTSSFLYLRIEEHGRRLQDAAGLDEIHRLPAKHFLQEDQAPAVAERIVTLAKGH